MIINNLVSVGVTMGVWVYGVRFELKLALSPREKERVRERQREILREGECVGVHGSGGGVRRRMGYGDGMRGKWTRQRGPEPIPSLTGGVSLIQPRGKLPRPKTM